MSPQRFRTNQRTLTKNPCRPPETAAPGWRGMVRLAREHASHACHTWVATVARDCSLTLRSPPKPNFEHYCVKVTLAMGSSVS